MIPVFATSELCRRVCDGAALELFIVKVLLYLVVSLVMQLIRFCSGS